MLQLKHPDFALKLKINTIAILQARTSSSRLPGKVLLPIIGKPMILHQLDRVIRSSSIDKLVVATSVDSSDDNLANTIKSAGFCVFRGDLNDVLKRFVDCISLYGGSTIVRLTGDCPLHDPAIIDEILEAYYLSSCNYLSNSSDPSNLSVPDGFDVEVFDSELLNLASINAHLPSEREHVTPWMRRSDTPCQAQHYIHKNPVPFYRLTVDDHLDFELVSKIISELYPINPNFDLQSIIDFLSKNPTLANTNINTLRNEGYVRSLSKD